MGRGRWQGWRDALLDSSVSESPGPPSGLHTRAPEERGVWIGREARARRAQAATDRAQPAWPESAEESRRARSRRVPSTARPPTNTRAAPGATSLRESASGGKRRLPWHHDKPLRIAPHGGVRPRGKGGRAIHRLVLSVARPQPHGLTASAPRSHFKKWVWPLPENPAARARRSRGQRVANGRRQALA